MKALICICTVILFQDESTAQLLPDFGLAFPQAEVAIVRITLNQDSLDDMLLEENWYSNHEYPATFVFESSGLTDTVPAIGFRLRGNTSREAFKKSFKVSFNTFDNNGMWEGLEKMNLNGEHNDPSLLRSKLCWDIIREAGLPGSRTSYVKFFVNDEYKGLYLNVEHIDEEFCKTYFDGAIGDGNLYKCLYPAPLDYLGSNPELYKEELFGRRIYDLKTNNFPDNYEYIATFIDALNNTNLNDLECEMQLEFHLDHYLKYAVLEILMGHWDGYIYNQNNFYLYHNQQSDLMEWIPYDLDNTLGLDWIGQNWPTRNIYNYEPSGEDRPLYERLMEVPELRARFSAYMNKFIEEFFNEENITATAQQWQVLIEEAALEDVYRTLDYGFDDDDFLNAIDLAWGEHVDYSISEYVNARVESVLNQLEEAEEPEVVVHWIGCDHLSSGSFGPLYADAMITGLASDSCLLKYSHNGTNWYEFTAYGEEIGIAGDNIYRGFSSFMDPALDKRFFKLECTINGELSEYLCEPSFMWTSPSEVDVIINETGVSSPYATDEFGEEEDWVELYNAGLTPMNLGDLYLTEEMSNWNKWQLPDVILNAGEFLLVWLDDDEEQGALHANFKINPMQNENIVWLVNYEEGEPRWVSQLSVSQSSIAFYELEPDGSDNDILTSIPTPGYSNNDVSVENTHEQNFSIYPNPADDVVYFSRQLQSFSLIDSTGRLVLRNEKCSSLNIAHLEPGVYILQSSAVRKQVVVQ
ncbi:MAG: CotH kinase family protein [Flavobacteriales bacterium]|nr:CotH kinase family protein [Flavobacteriales bacterium]